MKKLSREQQNRLKEINRELGDIEYNFPNWDSAPKEIHERYDELCTEKFSIIPATICGFVRKA